MPSTWEPTPADTLPVVLELIEQDRGALNKTKKEPEPKNLTKEEEKALKELCNTHSFIVKPADKGSSVVIMDKIDYKQEALRQLNDSEYYHSLSDPIFPQTITNHHTGKIAQAQIPDQNPNAVFTRGTTPQTLVLLPATQNTQGTREMDGTT